MISDRSTIAEAREEMDGLLEAGHSMICPVCDRHAKIYKRTIHAGMARELILLYRRAGIQWTSIPKTMSDHRGGDIAKLRYWGLIEERGGTRPDGSPRVGVWRVTIDGEQWVKGYSTLPKYARLFNGELIDLVGPQVSVHDSLGKRFSYRELMTA